MLSINKITASEDAVRYYAGYALEEGEAQGKWVGRAAEELQLAGRAVAENDLRNLLAACDPLGKAVAKSLGKKHVPGWDLTFSCPKSVSLVWAVGDEVLRAKIEQAQENAVCDALDYLEDHSAKSRIGRGGHMAIDAELVAGIFQHSSNREREPQLHTHTVICNVAKCTDGQWRTVDSRHIYKDQKAISAVYKASLAHRLRELGLAVGRTLHSFEVDGVPSRVRDFFSSRNNAISAELEAQGISRDVASRELKKSLALQTRKAKKAKHVQLDTARDFERWQAESADLGFTKETVESLLIEQNQVKEVAVKKLQQLAAKSLHRVTEERSVFEKTHFHTVIASELIGVGSYRDIKRGIRAAHKQPELELMRPDRFRQKYSTQEMMAVEKRVYQSIKERALEGRHVVRRETLDRLIESEFVTLNAEQQQVVRAATRTKSGVTIIQGVAGAGKSYAMQAVREAFSRDGYWVRGMAQTNKAARELSGSAGVEASSIDAFLLGLKNGKIPLSKRSVLIVDESGMVGSKKLDRLLQVAGKARAKVILLGDARQIQSIEAGQMFGAMHSRFSGEVLKSVVRQESKEAQALLQLREGKTCEALAYLELKGRLCVEKDSNTVIDKLVSDWREFRTEKPAAAALIIASRNETVNRLNVAARLHLKEMGVIEDERSFVRRDGSKIELAVNDTIVFTANDKPSGIYSSDIAKVFLINGSNIHATRSDGEVIQFDMRHFDQVAHGYALTAHRAQGTTVDRAFVYADGAFMDREKTYVALTRGRAGNCLYTDRASFGDLPWEQRAKMRSLSRAECEKLVAREYRSRLIERISRSGEKETTIAYRADDLNSRTPSRFERAMAKLQAFTQQLKGRGREAESGQAVRDVGIER